MSSCGVLYIKKILVSFEDRKDIASAQIEIVKLSSIHQRAYNRNYSFASILGLRDVSKQD